MFDLVKVLGVAVQLLTIVAARSKSTVDDRILALLTALQDSPQLLAWIQSLLGKLGTAPAGAMAQVDYQDAELEAAFEASPKLKEWAVAEAGGTSENLSIASVAALIKYLPMLIEIIKTLRNAGVK